MKRVLDVVAVAAALLSVAAPSSLAQGTTTSPGYNFRINVTMTDNGVVLSRSLAKRGWLAHFVITNKGTKAHVFDVGGLKRTVQAGKVGKIGMVRALASGLASGAITHEELVGHVAKGKQVMEKIPTLFERDERFHVVNRPRAECTWVFDGAGVAVDFSCSQTRLLWLPSQSGYSVRCTTQ